MMSVTTRSTGRPRLEPYQRLIQRFYETLILFKVLCLPDGEHLAIVEVPFTEQATRRRFLRNLAYICDYIKGGPTTTAIGLEEHASGYVFWVGCNTNSSKKIVPFLKSVLSRLKDTKDAGEQATAEQDASFLRECVNFSHPRVKKESKLLLKAIVQSQQYAAFNGHLQSVFEWMNQFKVVADYTTLCQRAYDLRNSAEMQKMEHECRGREDRTTEPLIDALAIIRHYIGRLAHHVRASRQLIEDCHLVRFLDAFKVLPVPDLSSVAQPIQDSHTTLAGMLKRMLPDDEARYIEIYNALCLVNRKFDIFERCLVFYEPDKLKPQVHAEIQVLEYFYNKSFLYANNDKFIGCSKPACLCCRLYIRYHPARCVEPETHQKAYTNWSPPLLESASKDPKFKFQRNILIKIIHHMREQVVCQIDECDKGVYRADSATGFTQSGIF